MIAESKLPSDTRPLLRDPEMAAAVETILKPLSGKALYAAQSAIRRVRGSPIEGPFSFILDAYSTAIADAVAKADVSSQSVEDWQYEVAGGGTRLGYDAWVGDQRRATVARAKPGKSD